MIEAKRKGKQTHLAADVDEEEQAPDLMTALQESIERSRGGGKAKASRRGDRDGKGLDDLSKEELERRARKLDVRGRSKMSKTELAAALRRAA